MIPSWTSLDQHERSIFRATVAFLNDRLAEASTIEWAVGLGPDKRIERIAIENLLSNEKQLAATQEPWRTAWRFIEESWSERPIETGPSTSIYNIRARLSGGDRSGALVSDIVDLVAPILKVDPLSASYRQLVKIPKRARTFHDLLSPKISSGELVDLTVLGLSQINETDFLTALAGALDSAVDHGLDIGRRIGWDGHSRHWQLGDLNRVHYLIPGRRTQGGIEDPDAYHHGIAPSVKLLFAVILRLAALREADALQFVHRWRFLTNLIHVRLWAAAAKLFSFVPAPDVASFLMGLDDKQFWDLSAFPEIAELRAARFDELDESTRNRIAERIVKKPPRKLWPRKLEAERAKNAQLFTAVRELRRIELLSDNLPARAQQMLRSAIQNFPELQSMSPNEGFPEGPIARDVPANPDSRYDALQGVTRLQALEAALASSQTNWMDDPASRASDWLRQPRNVPLVLDDLTQAERGGDDFPRVWEGFGWSHQPSQPPPNEAPNRNLRQEADRVLAQLAQLSDETIHIAIDGISNWLDNWGKQVVTSPVGYPIWQKAWPIAVRSTNERGKDQAEADLSVTASSSGDSRDTMDLDTLNTPAGKLVGVFLSACPNLSEVPYPFEADGPVRRMRDAIVQAEGRSGLIGRHRLIESIPYFLGADRVWAQKVLLRPLLQDDAASLALWRAISRRTQFTKVLSIIGNQMAERATDHRLGRETRRNLTFSLVVETLHAFREAREPAISKSRMTQMLRNLDDEVRAYAANTIQRFVNDVSAGKSETTPSAATLFRMAAAPFLEQVWPQERSLATPGVSKALADLPATSDEAFAEAVRAIERFLVPFDCWSMLDYGLYGDEDGEKKIKLIDDFQKAEALLHLLDLTIGTSEGAVIPLDLTDALDQIKDVGPQLSERPAYKRLATAARRL
jgi:hypothetical protein